MIKSNHFATVLVAILCLFSIVPLVNINVFLASAICLLYSTVLIGVSGRLFVGDSLFIIWTFDLFFLTGYLVLTQSKISSYNLILISLTIMGVAILSDYRSVKIEPLIRTMAFFSVVSICVWSIVAIIPSLKSRVGFDGTNGISVSAAILFYFSVWIVDKSKRKLRIALILVSILGIIVASERSNFVFVPFPAIAIYFYFSDKKKWPIFLKICLGVLIAFALFFFLRSYLVRFTAFARLYSTYDMLMTGDAISSGRDRMNDIALRLWKNKPIFGNGWFYFYYNNKDILENGQYVHVHNFILELLCDCGIVGTIVALVPFAFAMIKNASALSNNNSYVLRFTLSMQIFFFADSLFHVSLYSPNIITMYFITIIIMSVHIKQQKCSALRISKKLHMKSVRSVARRISKDQ